MGKIGGVLWGVLSGASFGLIPLFTLPLMRAGLAVDSVLFYRFSFAALAILLVLLIRGESLRITLAQLRSLALLGVFYMASAMFLLWGYEFMAAGVATTIHFLYPVCVVLIMMLIFGERPRMVTLGAVVLAIVGVAMLSAGDESGGATDAVGLIVVIISALAYALYIIGIKKLNLGGLGGFKLTLYVQIVTAVLFLLKATILGSGLQPVGDGVNLLNLVLLALIPTVVSNFALVNAIKIVGSTTTSILGAMEPMTAVAVGVLIFDEPINGAMALGMAMIVGAVMAIVLKIK